MLAVQQDSQSMAWAHLINIVEIDVAKAEPVRLVVYPLLCQTRPSVQKIAYSHQAVIHVTVASDLD